MARVLILGGTEDGRRLYGLLAAEAGVEPLLSLAGRTAAPEGLPEGTRIGGFGGAEGLAAFLAREAIAALVDATHPFASRISANAAEAAARVGCPRLVLVRPPWQEQPGDDWRHVASEAEAAAALPMGARAFLALGAGRLGAFAGRDDANFLVRVVDPPAAPLLPFAHEVVVARGPYEVEAEAALFAGRGVSHIVARNAGGAGAAAKLAAARRLGLAVIMIDRPPSPPGPVVMSAEAARDWVMTRLG